MSVSAAIILPNQLFKQNPILAPDRMVFLVEEWHYFNQYNFHKEKLVLHRASMKFYEQYLKEQGLKVVYIEANQDNNKCEKLIDSFKNYKISEIHLINPIDNWVSKKIQSACQQNNIELEIYDNPNFLNTERSRRIF
jgi:deoxyribodipyrimidine photolyase-related protein